MAGEATKRAYTAAAISAAGVIGAIIIYTVIAEILRHTGYRPPLLPPAAYAVKFAVYLVSASTVIILKRTASLLSGRQGTQEETLKRLTRLAIIRAAVCEIPAVSGLILFLLTGYRADFYLLIVFAMALEVYNFPRLPEWEARLRGDFGQL